MCRCLYTCATLCTHNPCKVSPTIHRPSLHVGDKKHHNLSRNTRGKGESCRTRAIDLNESQVHRANRKPNHDTFTIFGGRNKYAQVLILCQYIDSSLSSKEIMHLASSELSCASFSKRGQVHNLSYENEFYLHVNENSFSYERLSTKTCFEKRDHPQRTRKWPFRLMAVSF